MAAATAPMVITTHYEFSHRKSPRGFGSWAFTFRQNRAWSEPVFFHQASYADAKRKAIAEARARGADMIRVEP